MPQWLGILAFISALAFLLWCCAGCAPTLESKMPAATPVCAADSQLIGMLIGMSGGTIADAGEAQLALRRFEESTGRKATTQDLGFIVGMMSTLEPQHRK